MNGNRPLVVLATVAVVFLLYWGQPFFVPLLLSILISYALAPIVTALTKVIRYRTLSAALVVISIVALGALAVWAWSDDVQAIWEEMPKAVKNISRSVQKIAQQSGGPVVEVKKAAAAMESATQGAATASPAPAPTPLPMWQVIYKGWQGASQVATELMVVLFLVFFILASGDLFRRKLVSIAGERLSQRKDALRMIDEIDTQIRRYLGVLLVANVLVGLGTWAAFYALGMKYAGLWGLVTGIVHTVPYFGPALIAAASLFAAFLQFGEWTKALMVAGSTVAIATVIGMVFATWLASRTTRMNSTASFVGILF
ncbi:MAG: AI-2E family transporter, partial [Bacillota bacterium]